MLQLKVYKRYAYQCSCQCLRHTLKEHKLHQDVKNTLSLILLFNDRCQSREHVLPQLRLTKHSSLLLLQLHCWLPVDFWPIFDSKSWGSMCSANHTLLSFWGRSKSIICFWQIHHILTDNYSRSTDDCWVYQSRHQRAGKGSVDHFPHAAQQEVWVYCCIPLFQNIPSLQQRFCNILWGRLGEHEQWEQFQRQWSCRAAEVELTIIGLAGVGLVGICLVGVGPYLPRWPHGPYQPRWP